MTHRASTIMPEPTIVAPDYAGYTEFTARAAIADLIAEHGHARARQLIKQFMDEMEARHVGSH
ncbi:hypothetical protein FPY71_07095 [Aureimonas fodinaquatilis]|uniref:Uncharacterized protein n=1 Tax=Aureimonas fodinaquatilis TaxID=2565783 RepID=A0A5B0DWQ0_9HYPH|nr:hypothetical protein [Aureimonas fodinaquatilis]KAA0970285.1 hypothetical protein FPY71_07095 [Aureimonas fodinaquatilis]